jgi:hypothetical protein
MHLLAVPAVAQEPASPFGASVATSANAASWAASVMSASEEDEASAPPSASTALVLELLPQATRSAITARVGSAGERVIRRRIHSWR